MIEYKNNTFQKPPMNIYELAQRTNAISTEKGFWEVQNIPEKLMLIITELSEAVDAHRKNKVFNNIDQPIRFQVMDVLDGKVQSESLTFDTFPAYFTYHIKNTLEDELADAFIRILDLAWVLGIEEFIKWYEASAKHIEGPSENFAENMLIITGYISRVYENLGLSKSSVISDLAIAADLIDSISKGMKFDLHWHVRTKMKYNSMRPKMHGKAY